MKIRSFAVAGISLLAATTLAQTTVFTYQGRLTDNSSLASGDYDLRFQLFGTVTNGNPLTGAITNAPLPVANGLFVATLDFGSAFFDGRSLWLEIGVRPFGDTNAYTVLEPRQALTSAPYAIRAAYSGTASNLAGPLNATNLSGTIPDARLSTNVALRSGSVTFAGSMTATQFSGSGAGLTSLPATNLSGTIPDARLSANVPLQSGGANFAGHVVAAQFTGSGYGLTNVPGAFFWTTVAGNSVTAFPNTGYLATNDITPLTVTLPASPTRIGDTYRVAGVGAAGWIIAQNAGQTILSGNLTPNVGTGWTARDSSRAWRAIASSAMGTKLAAAVNVGYIYTSADSGVSWTSRASGGSRAWTGLASSADGTKLAGVVSIGFIYTSADSGATWSQREGSRAWRGVASSLDGTRLVACVNNGFLYVSSNSGVSWSPVLTDSGRSWSAVASSGDGVKLAACVYGGNIYTSPNSGSTWLQRPNTGNWTAIASSADGQRLAATAANNRIDLSPDAGATWYTPPLFASANWTAIASSADGARLLAAYSPGLLYVSTDFGNTWTQRTTQNKYWTGVAVSADGTKMAAVADTDFIYTSSQTSTTPGTNGFLFGAPQSAITLIYAGNNQFLPLNHIGAVMPH